MVVFLDLSDNHLGIVKHPPDAASPDALILWVWDGGLRIYTDTWDPCLFPMLHRKARSTREIPTCHEEGAVHGRPVLASPSLGRLTQENQVPGGEGAWLWGKFPESRIPSTDVLWSGHQACWEQPVCRAGVPALEVKSAEPHPVEVHPHLSPHGAMRLCGPCFLVLE